MSLSIDSSEYTVGIDKTFRVTVNEEGLELHENNYTPTVVFSRNKKDRLFQLTGTPVSDNTVEEYGKKFDVVIPWENYFYFEKPGRYYMRVFLEDNDGDVTEKGEIHLWVTSGPNKA